MLDLLSLEELLQLGMLQVFAEKERTSVVPLLKKYIETERDTYFLHKRLDPKKPLLTLSYHIEVHI